MKTLNNNNLPLQPLASLHEFNKGKGKSGNPDKITKPSLFDCIGKESTKLKKLSYYLSIKIINILDAKILQAMLSATVIYNFPKVDNLRSMTTHELIKLTKIEDYLDLKQFIARCTTVILQLTIKQHKEKSRY